MSVDPSNTFGAYNVVMPPPGVEPVHEEQVSRLDGDTVRVGPAGEQVAISAEAADAFDKMEGPRGVRPGDGYLQDHGHEGGQGEAGADGEESREGADREQPGREELTPEQDQQVQDMQRRDREVRAHEQAHMAAGGGATGGASYTYQVGPDGQQYAVGGEVPITIQGGSSPEQTIANAQQAIRAAMAPAEPSGSDKAVAAKAQGMIQQARQEISEARPEGPAEEDKAGEGEESPSGAESVGKADTGKPSGAKGAAEPTAQKSAGKASTRPKASLGGEQKVGASSAKSSSKASRRGRL